METATTGTGEFCMGCGQEFRHDPTLGKVCGCDMRPAHCRFRLKDEGKPYPRSGCMGCGATISTGLGSHCRMISGFDLAREPDRMVRYVPGASFVCEVPEEAGRLVASTVFVGKLYLAFENGLYVLDGNQMRKVMVVGGSELDRADGEA